MRHAKMNNLGEIGDNITNWILWIVFFILAGAAVFINIKNL